MADVALGYVLPTLFVLLLIWEAKNAYKRHDRPNAWFFGILGTILFVLMLVLPFHDTSPVEEMARYWHESLTKLDEPRYGEARSTCDGPRQPMGSGAECRGSGQSRG